ncbi:hypothetical protein PHYPSEUDO_013841 [Phytophthora pseudosyringae]|uniref:Uncharacterized protein n=1 Tax=Phytophthora pseudosyringae TaxID=221518 RepID=A0A8T1V5J1_9STRA|nr:hypothetical protein PHYPSEUDO_013841 [Phytophthora pseudosyringae]
MTRRLDPEEDEVQPREQIVAAVREAAHGRLDEEMCGRDEGRAARYVSTVRYVHINTDAKMENTNAVRLTEEVEAARLKEEEDGTTTAVVTSTVVVADNSLASESPETDTAQVLLVEARRRRRIVACSTRRQNR